MDVIIVQVWPAMNSRAVFLVLVNEHTVFSLRPSLRTRSHELVTLEGLPEKVRGFVGVGFFRAPGDHP